MFVSQALLGDVIMSVPVVSSDGSCLYSAYCVLSVTVVLGSPALMAFCFQLYFCAINVRVKISQLEACNGVCFPAIVLYFKICDSSN